MGFWKRLFGLIEDLLVVLFSLFALCLNLLFALLVVLIIFSPIIVISLILLKVFGVI